MTLSRATCPALVVGVVVSLIPSAGAAQFSWRNHIDASAINEVVSRDGRLYMATYGGLLVYDPARGTFQQFDNTDGLPSNALTCLAFTPDGLLYIGTEDIGVAKVRLSANGLTLLRSLNEQIDGLSSNSIHSVALWDADVVYGATPGAGTIRNDFASARYFARDGLPADDVNDVLPDGDVVLMATDGGIAVLDRLGLLRQPSGGPSEAAVLGTDGSRIWVGTSDGVWRLDPSDSSWTDIGPDTRAMQSLFWDGTTMWGGSTRNLFRYTGTGASWTIFRADSVLVRYGFTGGNGANLMRGLSVESNGDVYAGGIVLQDRRGPGMIRFDGTSMENVFPNTPGANDVIRLSQDIDGSMWASFRNFYVGKLTPAGTWMNYNSSRPGIQLPSNQFSNVTLLADRSGLKWFCTLSNPTNPRPLDTLDDGRDANYGNDVWERNDILSGGGDGLGSLNLQLAVEDPAGNRWFLSDEFYSSSGWWGIQILREDRSAWFQMNPGKDARMLSGNVTDVEFGSSFAYVALREVGVQVWSHGGYDWPNLSNASNDVWATPVSRGNGLPAEAEVNALALRSDRVLWIATSAGLFRYESGSTRRIPVYTGTSPGILNDQVRDVALDADQNLWVATDFGLNRIAFDDEGDIDAYTTAAGFIALSGLRYPLDIISPLAHASCQVLRMDLANDRLYVGTYGGLSVVDLVESSTASSDLSRVYLYPNPVYASRGADALKIQNIDGPVTIEVYNLEGELVHSQTADASGQAVWDLTTRTGADAGSGNYLVRISGNGVSVTKSISLLR
ncbi:MAG: T9SS type A sorting domain-containing protein [Candidatus Krumholzibacteria bacterium]|nr:T9SS type A sorting domain-containing protein [Candidatus Krumholzibacteria bacterium]MDH4336687.1 T9SS type A sorting domain-containing protein [Candidatus Krumholzibacteria bacterium]MDH5269030.1 T9SS type A sorting domain-containing protein [Candidatus Krumholzibacteria bacterium]